jgi:hypothetical protein
MNLGALDAIIEVGIGLNVGFGVMQQFRERLSDHLRGVTRDCSLRIEGKLQAVLTQLGANPNGRVHEDIVRAGKLSSGFDKFSTTHQHKFVWLAVLATLLLVGMLPWISICGNEECPLWKLIVVESIAVGPSLAWAGTLGLYYLVVRGGLKWIDRRNDRDSQAYEKLIMLSVHPSNPTKGSEPNHDKPSGD